MINNLRTWLTQTCIDFNGTFAWVKVSVNGCLHRHLPSEQWLGRQRPQAGFWENRIHGGADTIRNKFRGPNLENCTLAAILWVQSPVWVKPQWSWSGVLQGFGLCYMAESECECQQGFQDCPEPDIQGMELSLTVPFLSCSGRSLVSPKWREELMQVALEAHFLLESLWHPGSLSYMQKELGFQCPWPQVLMKHHGKNSALLQLQPWQLQSRCLVVDTVEMPEVAQQQLKHAGGSRQCEQECLAAQASAMIHLGSKIILNEMKLKIKHRHEKDAYHL